MLTALGGVLRYFSRMRKYPKSLPLSVICHLTFPLADTRCHWTCSTFSQRRGSHPGFRCKFLASKAAKEVAKSKVQQCPLGYAVQKTIQRKGFRFTRPLSHSPKGERPVCARNEGRNSITELTIPARTTRAGDNTALPSRGRFGCGSLPPMHPRLASRVYRLRLDPHATHNNMLYCPAPVGFPRMPRQDVLVISMPAYPLMMAALLIVMPPALLASVLAYRTQSS
jgi:hypothetical protein